MINTIALTTAAAQIDSKFRIYQLFVKTTSDYSDGNGNASFVVETTDDDTFTGTWHRAFQFGPNDQFPTLDTNQAFIFTSPSPIALPFVRTRVLFPPTAGTWSEINLIFDDGKDAIPSSIQGTATVVGTVATIALSTGSQNVIVDNIVPVSQSGSWTVTTVPSGIQNVNVNNIPAVSQSGTWTSTVNGTVTVNGSVTAIPFGTQAVSGIVTTDGTVTTIPSGVQTISGTVTPIGTLAVTGTVVPQGTVSVVEIGTWTSSVFGSVTALPSGTQVVSGTVTIVPSGTQAVAGTTTNVPSGIQSIAGTVTSVPSGTQNIAGNVSLLGTSTVLGTIVTTPSGTTTVAQANAPWPVVIVASTIDGVLSYRNLNLGLTGTLIKSGTSELYGFNFYNNAGKVLFIKFYDTTVAPTQNDTPKITIGIPPNDREHSFWNSIGIKFTSGLGVRATTGPLDNDVSAPNTNQAIVNIYYI